jgi:DNA modification methylase
MSEINLMLGDCLKRMKEIPDGSVDMVLTSPPYDNLRSYNGNNDQGGDRVRKAVVKDLRPFEMWHDMPEFIQPKQKEIKQCVKFSDGSRIFVRFENDNALSAFANKCQNAGYGLLEFPERSILADIAEQKITPKTKSIWFPFKSHWGGVKHKIVSTVSIKPRYPVYIVSKGRYKNGLTTKSLDVMGVKHYIVCEEFEADLYRKHTNADVLVLPQRYLDEYDTCDELGNSRSKGPGAARNFCIDHSTKLGFKRHWVMDDNLDAFHYLNRNEKLEVETPATLAAAEDFVDRYSNVPVSGFNYYSFCKKGDAVPPLVLNTRIYSCLLIENASGYRWRGRYNEDTDLSLRVLKDGLCTMQFNAFLCGKVTTQRMRGGNSQEFYEKEGTLPKSQMIEDLHPDCAKVVWKFNRWHHEVNYKLFKWNEPKLVDGFYMKRNYGLVKVDKN